MPVTDPEVVEAYDKFAQQYFEFSYEKIMQYQLTQFLEYLEGKRILDAGCGSGRDVDYLSELGFELVGVDASERLIELAKKDLDAEFHVMALEDLSFKKRFNGIWCHAALFYLSKEKAKEVLLNMNSLLEEKGVLYLGLLEGQGVQELEDKALNLTPLSLTLYSQIEAEQMLDEAGFEILNGYVEADDVDAKWINIFARKR